MDRFSAVAEHLARFGWLVLVASVATMILGSVVVAVWNPETAASPAEAEECENPPCLGGGGMPGLADLPTVISFIGYGLAILLGVPSAMAGVWSILRGRWSIGGRSLLVFVGPLLVLAGTELVPHVVNPCIVADLTSDELPGYCEQTESGTDIGGRFHALHHAVVGALPMALLYTWALRRWRPDPVEHE
jgi:hypothetical protein